MNDVMGVRAMNWPETRLSHGLGKETVVNSVSDVLYLRRQWNDQEATFGREIRSEIHGVGQE